MPKSWSSPAGCLLMWLLLSSVLLGLSMTVAAPQDQQMMDAAPQDQQGKDSAQQDQQMADAAQQDKQETTTPYKFAFLTEIEWTGDPHDLDAANDALSEIVREALEGGTRGPTELIRPKKLDDLYFHEEKSKVTVTTEHAMAAARADWLVKQVDATVEQQHADFELVLPRILVGGRYSLDKKAHGDFTSREEGTFKLEMRDVSAGGLAEVRVARGGLQLGRVLLALHARVVGFEKTRERFDPALRDFVENGTLEAGLRKRLWREVTKLVEEIVRDRLRPAFLRRRLSDIVPNARDRRRLKQYEEQAKESADHFVDLVLGAARTVLAKNGSDLIPIPDLREGFERKVLFVTIRGGFVATDGYAEGLTSAHRSGDAFFWHDANGSGFSIWGGIAFDDLSLTYRHYEAQVMGLGPSGSLSAEVYPLALNVHLRIDFDADKAYLEEFRINEAGDMQVEVTGLGFVLNWLASHIASWLLGAYRDRVVDELESRYATYFANILESVSLDELVNSQTLY